MKFNKLFSLLALIVLITACGKDEELTPETLEQKIEDITKKHMTNQGWAGVAIGVYDNGTTNFYAYGAKDKADDSKINQNTLFEIGDLSKVFTGALLTKLDLDGTIDEDDPLKDHMPLNANVPDYLGNDILLKHLANHSSALPTMPDNMDLEAEEDVLNQYTTTLLFEFLDGYTMPRNTGTTMEYSNLGYGILGYALKYSQSKTYGDLLKDEILTPLGMTNTFMTFAEAGHDNIAQGYSGPSDEANELLFSEVFEGSGGIKSSISDMLKFIGANLSDDTGNLYEALRKTHIKTIETPDAGNGFGTGWFILNYLDGQLVRFHDGGTMGYSSYMVINPETKRGVVVLINTNTDNAYAHLDIGVEIMKAVHEAAQTN